MWSKTLSPSLPCTSKLLLATRLAQPHYLFSFFSVHSLFTTIALLYSSFIILTCLHIFPRYVSLPSQSVQLLLTLFRFQSSIQIFIRMFLRHRNCLLYSSLYIFLLFSSLILFHAFFASFLFCFPVLPHSTTMSPHLLKFYFNK